MTLAERKRLHSKFFKELGPTGKALRDMFYATRAYFLAPDTDAPLSRYGQIRSVAAYVEAHYDEAITIPQLVEMTGMSETVFKQTFAKVFSMTPGHYLTTIRLNTVRRLLETTDKLLSEIAAETGFFDQSHLSRTFKKERGMTPGEYRRRHRSIAQA